MKVIHFKKSIRKLLIIIFIIVLLICVNCFKTTIISMNAKNFTSILDDVHHNVYEYSGDSIQLSGYVYRAADFKPNQFVIARNMKVSDTDYRIVGFLCESNNAQEYEENTWVTAKGTILLGDYHGPMPIIQIEKMQKRKAPNNQMVLPPPKMNLDL